MSDERSAFKQQPVETEREEEKKKETITVTALIMGAAGAQTYEVSPGTSLGELVTKLPHVAQQGEVRVNGELQKSGYVLKEGDLVVVLTRAISGGNGPVASYGYYTTWAAPERWDTRIEAARSRGSFTNWDRRDSGDWYACAVWEARRDFGVSAARHPFFGALLGCAFNCAVYANNFQLAEDLVKKIRLKASKKGTIKATNIGEYEKTLRVEPMTLPVPEPPVVEPVEDEPEPEKETEPDKELVPA